MNRTRRPTRRVSRPRPISLAEIEALVSARLSAGDSRFDAATYSVDGVSGKVASFTDLLDPTHTLVQALSTEQVNIPTADNGYKGLVTATFLAASTTRYTSSRAASEWAFLHGSAGASIVLFGTITATGGLLVATRNASTAAENGISLARNTGVAFAVGNGSATQPIAAGAAVASPTATLNQPARIYVSHGSAQTNDVQVFINGSAGTTADYASAPSALDPQFALTIGGRPGGAAFGSFRFRELFILKTLLTPADRAMFDQYARVKYGA